MKWPEIRAGVIAIAIFFGLVDGCPLPARDDTPAWERGFVEPIRRVQQVVLTPVQWIRYNFRVTQRFALFQASDSERERFVVEGQNAAHVWHLMYRAGDPDHDQYTTMLDYRRIRGVLEPIDAAQPNYRPFCDWLGGLILADQPTLVAVRFRFEKIHLVPGEVQGTGEFLYQIVKVRR